MTTETLQTPYGIFGGVTAREYYPDGGLLGLRLEEQNIILTHAGELIPYYGEDSPRRKYKSSVTFHKNGMIKAVSLEEQQEVMTPIGELPAELITFYETGEVHRVFPLDGKLSGFWSEEDERALGIPLSFDFGFASFTAVISGICFYRSGQIRSVTLFPGEEVGVDTGVTGRMTARHGFSLFETGELQSLEPAVPTAVETPVGRPAAYDVTAHGISADTNSLRFDRQGRVIGLVTSGDRIAVRRRGGAALQSFAPANVSDGDGAVVPVPLTLAFNYDRRSAAISGRHGAETFAFDDEFFVVPGSIPGGCTGDCGSCSLCGK